MQAGSKELIFLPDLISLYYMHGMYLYVCMYVVWLGFFSVLFLIIVDVYMCE